MSEELDKGEIEKASLEISQNLCDTPDVDEAYLTALHERVTAFLHGRRFSSHDEEIRRIQALKLGIASRHKRNGELKMGQGIVLEMISGFFNAGKEVLDGTLDSDEHIRLLADILAPDGIGTIIFSYPLLPPPCVETGRVLPEECSPFKRVIITDGQTVPLEGESVVVFRLNRKIAIEYDNIYEELMFTPLQIGLTNTILTPLRCLLDDACCHHLRATQRWGEIMKSEDGPQFRKTFLGQLEAFERFLETTEEDLLKKPEFSIPEELLAEVLKVKDKTNFNRKNPQLYADVETRLQFLYKKIEWILLEGEKIQQSKDEVGPRAELEYWRSRLTQLTALSDFIQSQSVQSCLVLVEKSLSQSIRNWSLLVDRIRTAVNEAADNVKYLHDFDRLSQALYSYPPPTLSKPVRDLLNNVRLIFSSSRYYNTTERVTAVLVKITNQLVNRCKIYLTDENEISIWSLTHLELIRRIQDCIDLHESYQEGFDKVDDEMKKNPKEKPFGCSQANVFVRLTTFCQRLEKIKAAVQLNLNFSILHSSCLEGISKITNKFDSAFRELVTKPYDPLDERKNDFENDYEVYQQKMKDYEMELRTFCSNYIGACPTVFFALEIIKRLEELQIPSLCLEREYLKQMDKFYLEMGNIMERYNEDRTHVRLAKEASPSAGRIMWIRSLLARIQEPMEIFKKIEKIMLLPRVQTTIRRYNRLCKIFAYYEMLHHEEWLKDIETVEKFLHIPILALNNDLSLAVNWNNILQEQITEVKSMRALNLPVPDSGFLLYTRCNMLFKQRQRLYRIVSRYNKLRRSLPEIYINLLIPLLYKLDVLVDSGLVELTWMSVELPHFCDAVIEKLDQMDAFLENIRSIKKSRIDEQLQAISQTNIIILSIGEPLPIKNYKQAYRSYRQEKIKELNMRIKCIEQATFAIVNSFVEIFDVPTLKDEKFNWLNVNAIVLDEEKKTSMVVVPEELAFQRWEKPKEGDLAALHRDCMVVYCRFFQMMVSALTECVLSSLSAFSKRLSEYSDPLIFSNIYLDIPTVKIQPSITEFLTHCQDICRTLLSSLNDLHVWGVSEGAEGEAIEVDEPPDKKAKKRDYYKIISDDREVLRTIRNIPGVVIVYTATIDELCQGLLKFGFLWQQDRQQHFIDFLEPDPAFLTIEDEMARINGIIRDVEALPDSYPINCVQFRSGMSSHFRGTLL